MTFLMLYGLVTFPNKKMQYLFTYIQYKINVGEIKTGEREIFFGQCSAALQILWHVV